MSPNDAWEDRFRFNDSWLLLSLPPCLLHEVGELGSPSSDEVGGVIVRRPELADLWLLLPIEPDDIVITEIADR